MQGNVTRFIAILVVSILFAAGAATAEDKDPGVDTTANDDAELNRDRARLAHNAAVEDAIQAVLEANKLRLDTRLIGRTSARMADSR